MNFSDFVPLVQATLRDPRGAARTIIALDLPREVLWTTLALVAAVNTIILQLLIAASPAEAQAQFPSYFNAPLAVYVLLAGVMVIYIHSVYWAGLALSGKGRLFDVLALIVWLQVLRTAIQIIVLVLTFILPALAGLVSLVAFAWGLWVLLNFMVEAMALRSIGHAGLALVLAIIGLVLGLGILLAIIGLAAQGTVSNV
ncbi:MAG: YIP1 family protein [Sulfitobacter sp.]